MHLGCRQNEDGIGRWLLERFEQGIKGLGREHVRFVKHVDLIFARGRRHHDLLAQIANAVDATIGSGIDLDDIE